MSNGLYVMEYREPGKVWRSTNCVWFTLKEARASIEDEGHPWVQDGYEIRLALYEPSRIIETVRPRRRP